MGCLKYKAITNIRHRGNETRSWVPKKVLQSSLREKGATVGSQCKRQC